MDKVKTYYLLAKPGIVYGNLLATVAAFLFASKGNFNLLLFAATVLGFGFIIGASCVINNLLDRKIDAKMKRTKNRALVTGEVKPFSAVIYAVILWVLGFSFLYFFVNILTVIMATIGVFFYVVVYGAAKRYSTYSTLVGSVSGSMPLVGGYTAVTNNFGIGGLLLFIVLAVWQLPHFYSLGIYKKDEYENAGLPILPVKDGIKKTKKQIFLYIILLILAYSLLFIFKLAGYTYLAVMLIFGFYWLIKSIKGFKISDEKSKPWGKSMFFMSLILLLVFCLMISANSLLP